MASRLFAMLAAAGKEFIADQCSRLGAALSYYTIFSLVPLLFLAVAIAGYVYGDPDAVQQAVDRATDVAGAEVGDSLESLLATVQEQRSGALSIGIALSAFAAANIFQQVQAVLASVFHVPPGKRREGLIGWIVRRLIGVAGAIGLSLLVVAPIAAVGGVEWLVGLLPESADAIGVALRFAIPLLSVAMLMLVTGVTFQALTAIEIPWRAALRGGATTALLGLTAAFLVGTYLNTAAATGTLGALGGVALLLFFFSLMWTVYLFGAEVTKVYADFLQYGDIQQPSERKAEPVAERVAAPATAAESTAPTAAFAAGALVGVLWGRSRPRR